MIEKALTCVTFMLLCMQNVAASVTLVSLAYVACGLYFLSAVHRNKKLPDVQLEVILLVFLALLSSLWSLRPTDTLVYGYGLLGASVVGVYVAYRYTLQDILVLLWAASAIMLVASIIMIVAFPEYGISFDEYSFGTDYANAWRGVFSNKNALGMNMLLSTVTFIYCTEIFKTRAVFLKIANYTLLPIAVLMLVLAHSVTVYVTAVSVLLFDLFLVLLARSGRMRFPVTIFCIWLVVSVASVYISDQTISSILSIVGRDPTLTNRSVIWAFAFNMIEARPILGYGYGIFWGAFGSALNAAHAHNVYLNIALDIGLLGVILLLVLMIRTLWRCFSIVMLSPLFIATWPATITIALIVNNFTEASLVFPNSMQWCLFVIVSSAAKQVLMRAW